MLPSSFLVSSNLDFCSTCMCVCVCERERGGGGGSNSTFMACLDLVWSGAILNACWKNWVALSDTS